MKIIITLTEEVLLVEDGAVVDALDHVQRVSGQAQLPDPVRTVSGFPEGLRTVEEREPACDGGRVGQLLVEVQYIRGQFFKK